MGFKDQFSASTAKKGYVAGVAAVVAVEGTLATQVLADGKIDGNDLAVALGVVIPAFVLGFFGAWLPTNTPSAASGEHVADEPVDLTTP